MGLDGALRDGERPCDLGVRHALREAVDHLGLALGQRLEAVRAPGARRLGVAHVLDEEGGDPGGEGAGAAVDVADADDDALGAGVLEQVSRGPGAQHRQHRVAAVERRHGEDAHLRPAVGDPGRRLDTVHPRHLDVHEHDIGTVALHGGDGLCSVLCLADDLDLRVAGDEVRERGAD